MKCLLSVCLLASVCVGVAFHAVRESMAQAQTRALQKGISVEMATASHAQAWPQADENDAWIVTVDSAGRLYFGTDPMTPEELKQWMIRHPRRRDQNLYIKADARATYAAVEKALNAAGTAEFAAPVLLVNQRDTSARPGIVVPPEGLEVTIDGVNPDAQATVVEIAGFANKPRTLTIDHEDVSWDSLLDRLRDSLANRSEKTVFVEAGGQASFAEVARVIDACGAVKAKAVLSAATL